MNPIDRPPVFSEMYGGIDTLSELFGKYMLLLRGQTLGPVGVRQGDLAEILSVPWIVSGMESVSGAKGTDEVGKA